MKLKVEFTTSQLVYAIGGLISTFRGLDEHRVKFAGKSVNDVTELAMRERLNALWQMVEVCKEEVPSILEDFDELVVELKASHAKTPWDTALSRFLI